MNHPTLPLQNSYFLMLQQARDNMNYACGDKDDGAACKLTEAGEAYNNVAGAAVSPSGKGGGPRPKPSRGGNRPVRRPTNPVAADPITGPEALP